MYGVARTLLHPLKVGDEVSTEGDKPVEEPRSRPPQRRRRSVSAAL